MEPLAAWREGRRHRLDPALHALSADERRRVPQGRRALAVREIASRRARAHRTDALEKVSSHTKLSRCMRSRAPAVAIELALALVLAP